MPNAVPQPDLNRARELARQGQTAEAERVYSMLLDTTPDQVESLNFLAMCSIERGNLARTLELLERAFLHQPADLATLVNLGAARDANGDYEGACDAYLRATRQDPAQSAVRLHLGHALEQLDRGEEALLTYFRAITDAQCQGRWLNTATTAPDILDRVTHAMRFVKAGRRRVFERVLEPVVRKNGAQALRRFQACLAMQVGDYRGAPEDPRQRPSFLYFPGLPTTPWFERSLFPWIADFERQTDAIRDELMGVLPRPEQGERVFANDAEEQTGLRGTQGAPSWNGFYFFRHGEPREANRRLCPRTAKAIDALPLVRIREQAPEVLFSVLTPGTHILAHRGVTNTRVVCHLPLIVPEDCALVVGGEIHHWREGQVVVFDDTFEHEAWNRGSRTRVVLIIDVWNPHLTPAERDAITVLIDAIGEFKKASAA